MLLEDPEPRVRLAVSECMRLLAELQGTVVWLKSRDAILNSIRACWVSQPNATDPLLCYAAWHVGPHALHLVQQPLHPSLAMGQ